MKKIIALLLLFTIGISSFSMSAFAQEDDRQWQLGDATHNFDISITDATEIQKYLAGLSIPSTNEEPQGCVCCICADVNEDRTIDIKDVTEIQKYLADIETDARCGIIMENYLDTTIQLSEEEEKNIVAAFKNTFSNYDIEKYGDVVLACYAELSNQSKLVYAYGSRMAVIDLNTYVNIKNYIYTYSTGRDVRLYINNTYYKIKDAYDTGIISDEILDEIAETLHFSLINTKTNNL